MVKYFLRCVWGLITRSRGWAGYEICLKKTKTGGAASEKVKSKYTESEIVLSRKEMSPGYLYKSRLREIEK